MKHKPTFKEFLYGTPSDAQPAKPITTTTPPKGELNENIRTNKPAEDYRLQTTSAITHEAGRVSKANGNFTSRLDARHRLHLS